MDNLTQAYPLFINNQQKTNGKVGKLRKKHIDCQLQEYQTETYARNGKVFID